MRVAAYPRVSVDEQKRDGFSISAQKARIDAFCTSQDWQVQDYYTDNGFSAKDLKRPGIQRLIKDAEKGKFDVVVVYKLDRLIRTVQDLNTLLTIFDKHNIKFRSVTEVFDTTTAQGRFFITLVAAMAAWERETTAERVYYVMREKFKTEGKRLGGQAPYGYDLIDGQLTINESEAKWVRWIFDKVRVKGRESLAHELNDMGIKTKTGKLWGYRTITYLIQNPVYYGYLRWNHREDRSNDDEEILYEGNHEPIISKDEFMEIQKISRLKYDTKSKGIMFYPFSGIIKCARCGRPFSGARHKTASGYRYAYRCTGKANYKDCDMGSISEQAIELEFLKMLDEPNYNPDDYKPSVDKEDINRQLSRVRTRIENIKELYFDDDISKDEYKSRTRKEKEKEQELLSLLESSPEEMDLDVFLKLCRDVKLIWNEATREEKKMAVSTLIEEMSIELIKPSIGGRLPIVDITEVKYK